MSVAEDLVPLLNKLDRREKLRLMQYLVGDLMTAETPPHTDWPQDYFKQTFGIFKHDPLHRPQQGVLEIRQELQ